MFGKMISLIIEGYCSMTLGASQFSSTTRNLVPRFKGWSKGESLGKDQHPVVISRKEILEAPGRIKSAIQRFN